MELNEETKSYYTKKTMVHPLLIYETLQNMDYIIVNSTKWNLNMTKVIKFGPKEQYCTVVSTGNVVENLDLTKYTLWFSVNGIDYGVAYFDTKKTK